MSVKKRLGVIALLVGALAIATVAAVLVVSWDSPVLGRELLRHANTASGMGLSASTFHLNVLHGAELGQLEARSRLPGFRYDLELARLRLQHAPLELLRGRLQVERAVAQSPRVTLRIGSEPSEETAAGARPAPSPRTRLPAETPEGDEESTSSDLFEIDFALSELEIEDGAVLVQRLGDDPTRFLLDGVGLSLHGLDFDKNAVTFLHGVTASGRIGFRELRFGTTVVKAVAARIELDRGRLELADMVLENEGRSLSGRLALDTNSFPFRYELSLTGSSLPVMPFADRVDFTFDGRGFGLEANHLTGTGTVSLSGGSLPDSGWTRALEEAAGTTPLVGARYEPVALSFVLQDERLTFERFSLDVPGRAMTVAGAVSLDGELHMDVTLEGDIFELRGWKDDPHVRRAP